MSRIAAKNLLKFWTQEVPSGSINGSNVTFTLSQTPAEPDAVLVVLDGLIQRRVGTSPDWSITGTTITMATAPVVGQSLFCFYIQKTGEA